MAGDLEARLALFEQRLWHGLLIARVVLPAVILSTVGVGVLTGSAPSALITVWLPLTLWTALSTPLLWSRLSWVRRLPAPFWMEVGVLTVLLCLGLGTRHWHIVHFALPAGFCALFVAPRPTLVICGLFAGAVWAAELLDDTRLGGLIEPSWGAITPTVVFVLVVMLPASVPEIFGEARRLARAQRDAASSIRTMRRAELKRAELVDVLQRALAPLAGALAGVGRDARAACDRVDASLSGRAERLVAVCDQVENTLRELASPIDIATGIGAVTAAEIARARRVGWDVRVEGRLDADVSLDADDAAAYRRLLRETLANACRHGMPPVTVRLAGDQIEVLNRAEQAPAPRAGHLGLASIDADAGALSVDVAVTYSRSVVSVRLDLSGLRSLPRGDAGRPVDALRSLVARRRSTFERALHVVRITFAVFVPVSVLWTWRPDGAPIEESGVFLATGVVFVVWAAASALARYPRPAVVIELLALLVINLTQGGMSGPWLGVSLSAIVLAAFYGGIRAAAVFTAALMAAMLLGNDQALRGAEATPAVATSVTVAVVAGLAIALRWAFDRLAEAAEVHEAAMGELLDLERRSAALEARADAQREVHNSLANLIMAASITHAGITRRTADEPVLAALGEKLGWAAASVRELLDSLQARAA